MHGIGVIRLNDTSAQVLPMGPPLLRLRWRGLQHSNPQRQEIERLVQFTRHEKEGGGGNDFHPAWGSSRPHDTRRERGGVRRGVGKDRGKKSGGRR